MAFTPTLLNKAVLIHEPHHDVSCRARVRIDHHQSDRQGLLSISVKLALVGFGRPVLRLNVAPEMVEKCRVISSSNADLIPTRMLSMLRGVTNASAVVTLMLDLNATGLVLVPPHVTTTTVSPAQQSDVAAFRAFAMICRSKSILLHFSKSQIPNDDLSRLRAFASALRTHSVDAAPFDYTGLNAGRGVQEKDWTLFDQTLNPPPYCRNVSTNQVLGKRCRDKSSPCDPSLDKPAAPSSPPPSWSPTEVNTPTQSYIITDASTDVITPTKADSTAVNAPPYTDALAEVSTPTKPSVSTINSPPPNTYTPSPTDRSSGIRYLDLIRPTIWSYHDKAEQKERSTVERIHRELKEVPDRLVRDILKLSGHEHLLATQQEADLEFSFESDKVSILKVERIIERRLDRYVEERLEGLTQNAFKLLTEQRLEELVDAKLPLTTDLFIDSAMESYRDQFYEDCKTNEYSLRETIDEGCTELRATADECLTEIMDVAREQMDQVEQDHLRIVDSVEEHVLDVEYRAEVLKEVFFDKVSKTRVTMRSKSV